MTIFDRATERSARWMAARQSRRSFLGRAGRVAVLVAGGPTLATLLADRAEARVCGQSGVTPKCRTFSECDGPGDVWGWCWYASPGCCRGGGLKKICDCCRVDYPNVHGYCPSGTNVRCIVESCWADPRVLAVPVTPIAGDRALDLSIRIVAERFGSRAPLAVVGDAVDHRAAGVAAAVAGALGGALFLTPPGTSTRIEHELQRFGTTEVVVVGPGVVGGADRFRGYADTVHVPSSSTDLGVHSRDVARWLFDRKGATGGARRAFCVGASGVSGDAAGGLGGIAGTAGYPLVVGIDAAKALKATVTYVLGDDLAPRAGEVAGAHAVGGASVAALCRAATEEILDVEGVPAFTIALAPAGRPTIQAAAAGAGPVVVHEFGAIDAETRAFLRGRRTPVREALLVGSVGGLDADDQWTVEGDLNHFDIHLLQGVSGQGLPVISQPRSERPVGRARVAGAAPADDSPSPWVGRANPNRR